MTAVASKRPLQGHKVTETWSALAIKGCVDDEREIEMAQNMERVSEHVSALLSMARDIGAEVDIQNHQIKTIAEKVRYSVFTTLKLSFDSQSIFNSQLLCL